VSSIEFVFALFELAFLLGNLLLEDHLHLGLHLGELLLVESALLLLLDGRVDLLEHAGVLGNTHLGELVRAVVLVEEVVGVLLELLHVGADQHLAQLDEVAVLLVVDLDDTPGVATTTDTAAVGGGDLGVGTNDGEGNLGHDLLVLGNSLLIVKLVAGTLEDLDGVVLNIGKDLDSGVKQNQISLKAINQPPNGKKNGITWKETYSLLEQSNLLVGQGIGLGDHRDQVDLGVEAAHDLDIQRLEGVASRLDEVDTGVDAVVDNVAAVNLVLSLKVGVETLLNVLDNRAPRVVVVDKVTEARGINDAQAETDTVLLNVGAGGLDRHGLGDDVGIGAGTLLRGVEGGVEQGVDEGRLSETRFTCPGV
jgi:hypothetical protein